MFMMLSYDITHFESSPDHQTKQTNWDFESGCKLLSSTSTIINYYYSD